MNAPTALNHLVPEFHPRPVPQALLDALAARFGAQCSTAAVVREQHGRDESSFEVPPPAEDFLARVPVRITSPLAVTTSRPSTFSRMVP